MNSTFELIHYNPNLPARIDVRQGAVEIPLHWHKEIELIYVLDGALQVNANSNSRFLEADSFLLINSAENHSVSGENAKAGGFPSKRTFIAKCKRAYNITPFQILKQKRGWGGDN